MLGRNKNIVELRLRMPENGWKELTALLTALLRGGVQGNSFAEQEGSNDTFDEGVFRALAERSARENAVSDPVKAVDRGAEEGLSAPPLSTAVFERETSEEKPVPSRHADIHLGQPFSAPAPMDYVGEEERSFGLSNDMETEKRREETADAMAWERRWERDCRRYDSGFPLR